MKHLRIKTRLFRRAALSLLTLVMAFTTQTAWADYGWYSGAMIIGGARTDCTAWSTDGSNPTDIGIVTDMTITSIAFNVWSDANDRAGANMGFEIWDGGQTPVGSISEKNFHLGTSTRITGNHDFAISWTGTMDLAAAVGLTTLVPGKTYYIDMWAKTYGNSGDEWYSNGGANYHAKLTYVPHGNCGTTDHESEVTWSLTSGGALTISGTGAMKNYGDTDEVPWNSNKSSITSVVIESGVTTIGEFAFSECANLASVSIPASVTTIGDDAFYCSGTSAASLTVNFAEGSTLATVGTAAFYGCTKLTSISIPASVTSIGASAFSDCSNLATITLHSNPFIDDSAFPGNATVTMYLTAHEGETNEYWATFYNMNYSFQADANTQVLKVERNGTKLTMHEVGEGIVNSGTAVVLKTTGGNPVMTKTSLGSSNTEPNSLEPVSSPDGMPANGYMYVLSKGTQGVGFYRLADGKRLGVGKAYLFYTGSNAREFFLFDDDATGISTTLNDNVEMTDDNVYDLLGRRVQNPTKGLYIVNGKKVIIK